MSRKGKPVSYQWYATDWLSDPKVQCLPLAARGLYREMLDLAWVEGGVLAATGHELARLVGSFPDEFDELWPLVEPFWEVTPSGLRNRKLDEVIRSAEEFREMQAEKGRAGARARWQGHGRGMAEPVAEPEVIRSAEEFREMQAEKGRAGARARWQGHGRGMAEPVAEPVAENGPPSPSPSPVSSSGSNSVSPQKGARGRAVRWRDALERSGLDAERLTEPLRDWAEMRRRNRKAVTQGVVDRAIKRLAKLSSGHTDTAVAIVEQSTDQGWSGFFEIKGEGSGKPRGRPRPSKHDWMQEVNIVPDRC